MADEQVIEAPQEAAPNQGPGPEPLQKLYTVLHDQGLYSKSFDEFKNKYSTPENIDKLYSVVHDPQNGLYSKSKDDFKAQYFAQPEQQPTIGKIQPPDLRQLSEQSPIDKIKADAGISVNTDPATIANQQHYQSVRQQALQEVESPAWKSKIFTGKVDALTKDQDMPLQAFQKVDPHAVEDYLDTKELTHADRYWLRNQIINYGNARHDQYYIGKKAEANIEALPESERTNELSINNAYAKATNSYRKQQAEAVANRLNNVGIDDKPFSNNGPNHYLVTGINKALMGAMNFAGDLGHQVSSILEVGNIPGISSLGYRLKTDADNLKARNEIPQNGEIGNLIAGELIPMALDMESLRRFSGAVGKPIYRALGDARASGTIGQFAEGAIGGLAVSPANSYIMAHQYYNDLIKQGLDPAHAAARSDQLLTKNMLTDMVMTPLQMGLLKMPTGNWMKKALVIGAEGLVSGTHFTLQDFNQKSTDNPAMHLIDYIKNNEEVSPMITGAILGGLHKAAVDAWQNWDVKSNTRTMFSYGRQYGADKRTSLPSNETIANNVLSALEMKDHPGRADELKQLTKSLERSGIYEPHETSRINSIIDDVAAVKDQVPKYGNPLQRLAVMNELLNQRSMERGIEQSGHPAAAKPIELLKKESDERIERIMNGSEPLYFVNGNETNKEQLLKAVEENPELLSSKGSKIEVRNDQSMLEELRDLKTKQDAVQKQSATKADVRAASSDSEKVVGGDEGKGTVDQKSAGQETTAEEPAPRQFLEARHGNTAQDEQTRVSGHDDMPLSANGKHDAERLANEIADDHNVTKVISSDLARGSQTAAIVAKESGAEHETRPELRPWKLGDFSGMNEADFKKVQKYFVEHPTENTYEGKKLGETFNEYKDRVLNAQDALSKEGPETMVINHSSNMNIRDAYENNGRQWTEQAAKDFLDAKSPEPAKLREPAGGADVAGDIEAGKISDDHLRNTIQQAIDETNESLRGLRKGDTDKTGDTETAGEAGRKAEDAGAEKHVPETEQGQKAGEQDTGTESIPGDRSTADKAGVIHEAGIADKHVKAFFKEDVIPAIKALGGNLKDGWDRLRLAFDPKYGVAEKALTHISNALGDRNKLNNLMDAGLQSVEKMFNKMTDAGRIEFIDKLKRGEKQSSPDLNEVAKLIRGLDKALYDEITKYKPSLNWKEDHYRVLWKTLPMSKEAAKNKLLGPLAASMKDKMAGLFSRRPLQGTQGWAKQATLEDMSEGIARGGVPVSTNPITMFKLAYADGMKYITAQRMWENLKSDKFVKFVRSGKDAPDGFVRLDDHLASVYFKTKPEFTLQPPDPSALPAKQNNVPPGHAWVNGKIYKVEYKGGVGPVKSGEYWIEAGAGRLLNNHLSRDYIREAKIGKGLMALKNMYTAAELSISGFHAVAEGLEAISSQIGIGLRRMINLGQVGRGLKDLATAPAAFVTTASIGNKAMKFATSKDFRNSPAGAEFLRKFPGGLQYVDDFFNGGGITKQHEDLKAKTAQMWNEQRSKDNYIGAVLRAVPAANEMIMDPLFNTYIPRLKVGMFFKEFPVALAENAGRLAKGTVTREQLARRTINFIDDRLGEMNFDNLYWNRTFKTALQFFLRSVTWKLGNIRGMLGVVPEQGMEIYRSAKEGRRPNLMPKAAWLLGLSAMQVALSSLIQNMLGKKPLESFKDVVAPRINPEDDNERVILPTYYKDMLHMKHSPLGYVTSSMSGPLSRTMDVWNNKDFYGYEIHDRNESYAQQAKDMLLYVAPNPFSVSSMIEMHKKGEPFSKQVMSFAGLVKAPGYLEHTDLENKIFDLYALRNAGTKPKLEKQAGEAKKNIRELYHEGKIKEAHEALQEAVKSGVIRPSQVKQLIKRAAHGGDPTMYFFKTLPFEDKKALFEDMSDEEKKLYDPKHSLEKQLKQIEKAKK